MFCEVPAFHLEQLQRISEERSMLSEGELLQDTCLFAREKEKQIELVSQRRLFFENKLSCTVPVSQKAKQSVMEKESIRGFAACGSF